ncbi:hypothetical protein JT142_06285, partial [Helicobacter pylori]|nr:hypothetical protein [Helicobacter pylori]
MIMVGVFLDANGNERLIQSKSHLIAPYDQYLRHFPKFIQQLDMESNGKRISKKGEIIP